MREHLVPTRAQLLDDGVGNPHSFVGGDGDAHGSMMQERAQAAFDRGVRGVPGEADDAVAGRLQCGVTGAVVS